LIHRDIKPANILLENGVERVRITDFGLARPVDEVGLTRTGDVPGTPQYMSPEQAQGQTVDARSDLFSLGCVLYAMCTGRSPFRAETMLAALRRVCDDTPRPIRKLNAEVPEWMTEIVDRLLAKEPAGRIQTAAEVADLLGRHLAHVQDPASVPLPEKDRRSRSGRRRRAWWATGLLLAALASLAFMETTGVTKIVPTRIRTSPGEVRLERNSATVANASAALRSAPVDLLPRAASSAAPPLDAEGSAPCVVLDAGNTAERGFATLAEAVRASRPGGTIELRANGPFLTDAITLDHALTIRAGEGFRPVIRLREQDQMVPLLLCAKSALVLEGLEFQRAAPPTPKSSQTVIQSLAILSMANCRLLTAARRDILWIAGRLESRNCEFLTAESTPTIACHVKSGADALIENCVFTGAIFLNYRGAELGPTPARVELRRNTIVAGYGLRLDFGAVPHRPPSESIGPAVRIHAAGNVIDGSRALLMLNQSGLSQPLSPAEAQALLRSFCDWREEHNVYRLGSGGLQSCVRHVPIAPPDALAEWELFWGLSDTGTIHGAIRFQGRARFDRTEELDQVTPNDFRLGLNSAGYRAGSDGEDLGANVDYVGPGKAYERWKQEPDYRRWLAERAHSP
jgi:hypothetical protein